MPVFFFEISQFKPAKKKTRIFKGLHTSTPLKLIIRVYEKIICNENIFLRDAMNIEFLNIFQLFFEFETVNCERKLLGIPQE